MKTTVRIISIALTVFTGFGAAFAQESTTTTYK